VDGGNFGTLNQDVSLGGAFHGFDYFSEFSRFDTQGSYPNNFFHNATVSANLGWDIAPTTGIRATVRHTTTDLGAPNGIDFYGISDDSTSRNENTYVGVTAQQQTNVRWHNSIQFAFASIYFCLRQSVTYGRALRSIRIRAQLPGECSHHSRSERLQHHRPGHPRFWRSLSRIVS